MSQNREQTESLAWPDSFMVDRLHVSIFPNRAEMGAAAGRMAGKEINSAIDQSSVAKVIFAAAPSQNETLATLADTWLDWKAVIAMHLDEYVGLSADAPQSFRRFLLDRILSKVPVREFHGLRGEAEDLVAECQRYGALVREQGTDVALLGIGENGHLAFNDPPLARFDDPDPVRVVDLTETCRVQQVNDGAFATLESVPKRAFTLTIPTIMRAECLIVSVPGKTKQEAVRATLEDPISAACPASILRTHVNAHLFLDADSAALLKR